jgi:hypothetical protein
VDAAPAASRDVATISMRPLTGAVEERDDAAAGVEGGRLVIVGATDEPSMATKSKEPFSPRWSFIADHSQWKSLPAGSVPDLDGIDLASARTVVDTYLAERPEGGWLQPRHAATLLRAFGIPTVEEVHVGSASGAAAAARRLGYPVALKAVGDGILHKSDVGAVRLGLRAAADVRAAFIEMSTRLGDAMQGAVVQPMLRGVETISASPSSTRWWSPPRSIARWNPGRNRARRRLGTSRSG